MLGHFSPTEDENMAASLRLGRQGILFGLRLTKFTKCSWVSHSWQDHVRHFFQSPSFFGKCWRYITRLLPGVGTSYSTAVMLARELPNLYPWDANHNTTVIASLVTVVEYVQLRPSSQCHPVLPPFLLLPVCVSCDSYLTAFKVAVQPRS